MSFCYFLALVDLRTPLSLGSSFSFPLQSALSRKEVLIGALLLLLPGVGWILNMGHRIMVVHRLQHGRPAWPAWEGFGALFKHGFITFLGMLYYSAPGLLLFAGGYFLQSTITAAIGVLLFLAAVIAIPGYMSHYCVAFDASEIYNPLKAMRRVGQGGALYWRAWGIALTAMALSFLGLLGFGLFFLVTSVWFWQVAGFSFASVFSSKFDLLRETDPVS